MKQLQIISSCLVGLGVLLSTASIAADKESAESGADWPRFLGPNANGKSPETGLLDQWPDGGPRIVWHKPVGKGYGAPSIRGRRLVLHHRKGSQEIVECLDAATGEPRWEYRYPSHFRDPYGYNNGPRATPLLTEERCYAFGAEGMLVSVDLETGELLWQRDTSEEWDVPEAFFGVGSSPVLEGGLLLVMVGGQPNAGMVALDPKTGETVWESVGKATWQGQAKLGWPGEPPVEWRPDAKQASYATPVMATVNGRRTAFCFMRQGLVTLNPETGEVYSSFWFRSRVNESVNAACPTVVGNRVFISAAYYNIGSVLLEVTKGAHELKPLWRDDVLEIHWSTPIEHNGYLYAFSGRDEPDARFRCVEMRTGNLMWDRDESWRRTTRQPEAYGRGSAILADKKLIVLGEGGLLGLFKPTPKQSVELDQWQVPQLKYPCWTGPVLAHHRLYLRSENHLVCIDMAGEEESSP